MKEFKVGEKVKIVDSIEWWRVTKELEFTNNFMCEYCGKTATITRKIEDGYNLDIDDGKWWWQGIMLNKIYTKNYKAELRISTYMGSSFSAKHYYGTLIIRHEIFKRNEIELTRPITQLEINSDPDRFLGYKVGDDTICFGTWRNVINACNNKAIELGLNLQEIIVEGIPNNDEMSLQKAISEDIDTRLKCSICGKVIDGGCYNLPSGVQCVECHDNK